MTPYHFDPWELVKMHWINMDDNSHMTYVGHAYIQFFSSISAIRKSFFLCVSQTDRKIDIWPTVAFLFVPEFNTD